MKYTRTWTVKVSEKTDKELLRLLKHLGYKNRATLGRVALEEMIIRYPLKSFEKELI